MSYKKSIKIPYQLLELLEEKLEESNQKFGFEIAPEAFIERAIQERMERYFTIKSRNNEKSL